MRCILLATDDDEILLACHEVQVPVRHVAAITGVEPPARQDAPGLGRIPMVADEERIGAQPDVPELPVSERTALLVPDLDLATRNTAPDGDRREAGFARLRDPPRRQRGAVDHLHERALLDRMPGRHDDVFCQPPCGRHRFGPEPVGGEAGREVLDRSRQHGFRGVDGDPPAAEVETGEFGRPHPPRAHRIGEIRGPRERATIVVDRPQPERRLTHEGRRRDEDRRASREERHQEGPDQAHVVIERNPVDADVVGAELQRIPNRPDVVQHRAVGEQHALRRPGRARGVLHRGDVLGRRASGRAPGARDRILGSQQPRAAEHAGPGDQPRHLGVGVEHAWCGVLEDRPHARGVDGGIRDAVGRGRNQSGHGSREEGGEIRGDELLAGRQYQDDEITRDDAVRRERPVNELCSRPERLQ